MNLKEIKSEILINLKPFLEQCGFKLVKKSPNLEFIRHNEHSEDNFGMSFSTYVGSAQVGYGYGKSHYHISEIINEIAKNIKLSEPVTQPEESFYIAMGQGFVKEHNLKDNIYSPESAKDVCERIIKRSEEVIFPLLSRFEDLREIDKVINNLDDFWDWDVGKPFRLGGNFNSKRMIIAKLSGNPRYEEVVEKYFNELDKKRAKENMPPFDRNDLTKPTAYTVHFLKDIKPLYDSYE